MGGLFEAEGFFELLGEVELVGVAFETCAHPGVGDVGFGGEDGTAVVREVGDIRHGNRLASNNDAESAFSAVGGHLAIVAVMFLTAGGLAWWSRRGCRCHFAI